MAERKRPRVCIIITAYNYGHFLAACLDSVYAQTTAADEVVVINDGSSDATADILASETGVRVISQPNSGQAAAFNAGFAATTSEVIVFLDADDRLKPDAVDCLKRIWSDDLSALSFGLDMVDRDGLAVGQYNMLMPEVDLLSRLIEDISMPFMPTSGNAFHRRAVAYAFPLPEPRWKISADAVLIRAAVLAGPMRHTPHVLGEYRVHRHNNWFQQFAASDWRLQRGHADIARCGVELVDLAGREGGPRLGNANRFLLLLAALRAAVKASALGEVEVLRAISKSVLRRWSVGRGLRAFMVLGFLRVALPLSSQVRGWLIDRPNRPELLERIAAFMATGTERDAVLGPRAPFTRQLVYSIRDNAPFDANFPGSAWSRHWTSRYFDLCRDKGEIVFTRPTSAAVELEMTLEPPADGPVKVELRQDGATLERFDVTEHMTQLVQLRATSPSAAPEDRIELRVTHLGQRPIWRRRARRLVVHSLKLVAPAPQLTGAVLPIGQVARHVVLERALQLEAEHQDTYFLAAPVAEGALALVVGFDARQAPGWLTLHVRDAKVFQGNIGPHRRIVVDLADVGIRSGETLAVRTSFQPDDFGEDPTLNPAFWGWSLGAAPAESDTGTLASGRWMGPDFLSRDKAVFGDGWENIADGQPTMFGSTANLLFSPGPVKSTDTATLKIDVAPVVEFQSEDAPTFLISLNGTMKFAARIGGRHVFEITFQGDDIGPDGVCDLGFHAARHGDNAALVAHDGISLFGLMLEVKSEPPRQRHEADRASVRCLKLAHLALDGHPDPAESTALAREINGLATRALSDFLTPEALGALAQIGRYAPLAEQVEPVASDLPDWLRWLALSMLNGPPNLASVRLADFPTVDQSYAAPIGAWLGTPALGWAVAESESEYAAWLLSLLRDIREVLVVADTHGSRFAMAVAALTHVDLGNTAPSSALARAFVDAVEALPLRSGVNIRQFPLSAGGGVGFLVGDGADLARDLPSGKVMAALSTGRPIHVFVVDGAVPEGAAATSLAGQSAEDAARHILGLGLDALLIAGPLHRFDLLAQLAARRLAKKQMMLGANWLPFDSLDGALRGMWFGDDGTLPGLGFFLPDRDESTEIHAILAQARSDKTGAGPFVDVAGATVHEIAVLQTALEDVSLRGTEISDLGEADYVIVVASTAEEAVEGLLHARLPGIVCARDPAECQRLRFCLTKLGLEPFMVNSPKEIAAAFRSLQERTDDAREALDRALNIVAPEAEALSSWLAEFAADDTCEPRYLFHHMVKTGGTSVRHLFHDWFDVTEDYRDWWVEHMAPALDLSQVSPGQMLAGHFGHDGHPLATRYPALATDPNWRRITFVRDPFEQALSWYNFEKQNSETPGFEPLPIDTFFETYEGKYLEHFECDATNWKDVVDSYFFVGTYERLQTCVDHLALVLDRPEQALAPHNVTGTKERPSPGAVRTFVERMQIEFEIYRYIDAQLSKRLSNNKRGG